MRKEEIMKFEKWLDTLVSEKGLDLDHTFEYNGPVYGMNMIPLESVIEQIKEFHPQTQPIILPCLDLLCVLVGVYFSLT